MPERQILCRHLHTLICRLFNAFLTEIDAYEHDYNSQDSEQGKDGQSRFIGAGDIVCQADAGTADGAAGHGEGGDKTINLTVVFEPKILVVMMGMATVAVQVPNP